MSFLFSDANIRLGDLYAELKRRLEAAGIANAALEARWLLRERVGVSAAGLVADPDKLLAGPVLRQIGQDLEARVAGKPLSRIFGRREFWGMDFLLGADTLDPRPDTEILVETALAWRAMSAAHRGRPLRVLDLGTGSGCILAALLTEWPDCFGVAVDRSPGAALMAKVNFDRLGLSGRAAVLCGDWASALVGTFDVIVSNPPYIVRDVIPSLGPEVATHDPILALDGGEDGLDAYRALIRSIPELLASTGAVFFEIGFDQEKTVSRLVEDAGLRVPDVRRDLAGHPRVLRVSNGDNSKKNSNIP